MSQKSRPAPPVSHQSYVVIVIDWIIVLPTNQRLQSAVNNLVFWIAWYLHLHFSASERSDQKSIFNMDVKIVKSCVITWRLIKRNHKMICLVWLLTPLFVCITSKIDRSDYLSPGTSVMRNAIKTQKKASRSTDFRCTFTALETNKEKPKWDRWKTLLSPPLFTKFILK